MIPHAAPLAEAGVQAATTLHLPELQALLARCREVERDTADAWSLNPPHERARARALGLQGASGQLPWAALQAQADGVDVGDLARRVRARCQQSEHRDQRHRQDADGGDHLDQCERP